MNAWLLLKWAGVIVCTVVLLACICRVNLMRAGRHKAGWLWLYTFAAPFALGILIDLVSDREVDWYTCFGIAALLLHVGLTRHHWRRGAPPETERAP